MVNKTVLAGQTISQLIETIYVDVFGIPHDQFTYDPYHINWPMAWILNHCFLRANPQSCIVVSDLFSRLDLVCSISDAFLEDGDI